MNWFRRLLRKPAAASSAARPPQRSAAPVAAAAAGRPQPNPAPRPEDPPAVWVAAVCQAADKSLALAWTASLAGDAWLGEVATAAGFAEVRLAAARRIEDSVVLERVAEKTRDKDKGVYRHCFERLRQRRQAEAGAQRAAAACGALRGLLDGAPLPLSRVLELEKEIAASGDAGAAFAEASALLDQARARLQEEALARRDLQLRATAAAALRGEISTAGWPAAGQVDAWMARLAGLAAAHAALPAWLASQAPAPAVGEAVRDSEARLQALAADGERLAACTAFLAAQSAGTPLDATAAAAWEALAKPEHPAARAIVESGWQALQPVPAAPAAPPVAAPAEMPRRAPPPKIDHDRIRNHLDQLEQALADGHIADAEAAAQQIDAALAGQALQGAAAARQHRALAQLGELRGWARWSTGQAREQLIAAAGKLLDGKAGVDDLARTVPELRKEWQRLNALGAATRSQWEQFDAALEQAYRPVAARHAEETAQHAAARAAKEALCAEWEGLIAGIDWAQADYRIIAAGRQEMIDHWRAAPQSGYRDERVLRKRFDALLAGIDRQLDAVRGAEIERRRQLIAAAEALRDAPNLGAALAEARALQERWRGQAGPLRLERRDEEKLWQGFRAACDAVFARRDAQRAEQVAERETRSQRRQSCLDDLAATVAAGNADAIRQALSRFRADWGSEQPNRRGQADALEVRARELQQQAQAHLDLHHQARHRARYELLAKKAALAEGIEAAASAQLALDDLVAAAGAAANDLPKLAGKSESRLAARLHAAPGATAAALAAGREAREAILLDLEIALGLPSPEAFAEARRRRQLARLQDRFGSVASAPPDAESLVVDWYATAAAPDAGLEQRMVAVVNALVEHAAGGDPG